MCNIRITNTRKMTRVHAMLSELGRQHAPTQLQNDIKAVLQSHTQFEAHVDYLDKHTATLQQLALLSYIFNKGLILMADQENAEAMHFHSVFDENTLTSAQESDVSDLKTFEEELAALTLPDDNFTTGGTVTRPE